MNTLEFLKIWIYNIVQPESVFTHEALFFQADEILSSGHPVADSYYSLERLDIIHHDESVLVFDFEDGLVLIKRDKENIEFRRKDGQVIYFTTKGGTGACDAFASYLRKGLSVENKIELESWVEYRRSEA